MSKQVFEGVVREHTSESTLKVIDIPHQPASGGWIAVKNDHPSKLGERYRVTIERLRAPLPDGYEWDGNAITGSIYRWCVGTWLTSDTHYKAVEANGTRSVPSFVIDAFKAEGLL